MPHTRLITEATTSQEIDRYLLQLWPAPMAPDAILRQTSEHAAYWHRVAEGEMA